MKTGTQSGKNFNTSSVKAAVFAVVAATASIAEAGTLQFINPGSGYRQGPGGEFQMNIISADTPDQASLLAEWATEYSSTPGRSAQIDADGAGPIAKGFGTFCLEKSEFLNWNTVYNFAISDAARNGGGGAINGADKISLGTAFLYSQFALGQLAGYNYTAGTSTRAVSATALQDAIWFLEREQLLSDTQIAGNVFLQLLLAQTPGSTLADWGADANGAYGVAVLNITTLAGGRVQDQLVFLGNNGAMEAVPDGGSSALLLGLSILGIAATRRMFAPAA